VYKNILNFSVSVRNFVLLTVASKDTINLRYFRRSAKLSNAELKVLGMEQQWQGLGQKISLLIHELKQYRDDYEKIIMFADSYDSLVIGKAEEILKRFIKTKYRVLFSAEHHCEPDRSICHK